MGFAYFMHKIAWTFVPEKFICEANVVRLKRDMKCSELMWQSFAALIFTAIDQRIRFELQTSFNAKEPHKAGSSKQLETEAEISIRHAKK